MPSPVKHPHAAPNAAHAPLTDSDLTVANALTVDGERFVLVGSSIRYKFFFKVYGFVLYAHEEELKQAYEADAEGFRKAVKEGKGIRAWLGLSKVTLRGQLVFMRSVSGADVAGALDETVRPLYEKEKGSDGGPVAKKVVDADCDFLRKTMDGKINEFDTIDLLLDEKNNRVEVGLGGSARGAQESRALCRCLKRVYLLGDVVHKLKERLDVGIKLAVDRVAGQ